jgi:predicted transposase YbfD/YdcC
LSKKTVSAIISSGNDYLITVKANQQNLHSQIANHCQMEKPIHQYQKLEISRDRSIERNISVFSPPAKIDSRWIGVNCVIKVFRHGTRGGQPYQSPRETYYICSLSPNSSLIPRGIRSHWQIENRLHWVKDVVQCEDTSPQLDGNASPNISILKSWVLSLLRVNGYDSLTEAIRYFSHNLTYLRSFCY